MDSPADLAVRETTFIDIEAEIGKRFTIYDDRALSADVSLAIGALAAMGFFAPAAGLRWLLQRHANDKIRIEYLSDRLTQTQAELEEERQHHLENVRQLNPARPDKVLGCESEWSEYLDRETGVGAPIDRRSDQRGAVPEPR